MSRYCLVEDSKVKYRGGLPINWRNVTGLHLASDAELKEKGWLPYTEEAATLSKYEISDGIKDTIKVDSVVGVEQKRAMTEAEKKEQDLVDATGYQLRRKTHYGTWEEQLDIMYHSMDDWKAHVKAVKDKYPKP